MRSALASLAVGGALMAPLSAIADIKPQPASEAREVMRQYVQCMLGHIDGSRRQQQLVRFLTGPNTAETYKQASNLQVGECLGPSDAAFGYYSRLSANPVLMRGAIFRALYLGLVKGTKSPVKASQLAAAWNEADEQRRATQKFGDCVVARDRTNADLAVRSDVRSEAEIKAYQALQPAFANCVVEGNSMRFSKSVLEGILSEALYKQVGGIVPAVAMEAK